MASRWNWLAARAEASFEFYEGSPSRREAAGGPRRVAREAEHLFRRATPLFRAPRRPWRPEGGSAIGRPPEAGSASLDFRGGGVLDGIGALPDGIGLCPLAIMPARAENGGTGSPPVRGHRQNFTKVLRTAGRPPVVGQRPYSIVHPAAHGVQRGRRAKPNSVVHPAAHGLQRGRATLRRPRATPLFHRAPRRP